MNVSQLEYNSADYLHAFVNLDELEKVLKLTKNGKTSGQDNMNSHLYKYAQEEFNPFSASPPRRTYARSTRLILRKLLVLRKIVLLTTNMKKDS